MITVAGLTPSLDLTYVVDSLRLGQIHRVPTVVSCAGGKALNMARAASTAGGRCAVVAILGGPTGDALRDMLVVEGLDVIVVRSPNETRTCVSIAATDSVELTEIYQDAATIPPDVLAAFTQHLEARLSVSPGWLSISGRVPAEGDGPAGQLVADLVALGHRHGARVAVDTHSEALPGAVDARPAVVKINRYEAAELLGLPAGTELVEMASAIHARSGGIVVVTDGAAGSLAFDGQQALVADGPAAIGRFPVGSGDSFLGGLLARLDAGADLPTALRTAAACGVANALVPGQGHFSRESLAAVEARVRIRPLG